MAKHTFQVIVSIRLWTLLLRTTPGDSCVRYGNRDIPRLSHPPLQPLAGVRSLTQQLIPPVSAPAVDAHHQSHGEQRDSEQNPPDDGDGG